MSNACVWAEAFWPGVCWPVWGSNAPRKLCSWQNLHQPLHCNVQLVGSAALKATPLKSYLGLMRTSRMPPENVFPLGVMSDRTRPSANAACSGAAAALEDLGAATDAAAEPAGAADADPLAAAGAAAETGAAGTPLAPATEPDGMSQLASVDADQTDSVTDADEYGAGAAGRPAVNTPAELPPLVIEPGAAGDASAAAQPAAEAELPGAGGRREDTSMSDLPVSDPSARPLAAVCAVEAHIRSTLLSVLLRTPVPDSQLRLPIMR